MTNDWITNEMVERAARSLHDANCDDEALHYCNPLPCDAADWRGEARSVLTAAFPDGPGAKPMPIGGEVSAIQFADELIIWSGPSVGEQKMPGITHWRDTNGDWWRCPR